MLEEDKNLLLKDLCTRLSCGVMLNIEYYDLQGDEKLKNRDVVLSHGNIGHCFGHTNWVSVKPYLRPMSSMTKEEKKEYELLANHCIVTSIGFIHLEAAPLTDWLNAHHFDYRNLIERNLALEAPEGMYNLNRNK